MLNRVSVDALQKVSQENFNNFGEFPRRTFDTVLRDTYGAGLFYAGFICTDAGSGQLRVGAGRLYNDGIVYYNDTDGGESLDLLRRAPVSNSLWVAIAVTGKVLETDIKPTTYLTDTATRDTTARNKAQEIRRWAQIDPIVGLPGPDPVKPLGTTDSVIVAWVRLDNTGIVSIEANVVALAPSTIEHRAKLADLNGWRGGVGAQLEALGSNMAGIALRMADMATQTFANSLARDMGQIKDLLRLPQDYSSYQNEYYLDETKSDVNHIDYLAKVEEGIRFPPAIIQESQVQLLNPQDPNVVLKAGLMFPTYFIATRLSNVAFDKTQNMANATFDTYEVVQKSYTRERIRAGTWYSVCTNHFYYHGSYFDERTRILTLFNGETYEVSPEDAHLVKTNSLAGFNATTSIWVRARQVWFDGYEDVAYTETFVNRSTVSGFIMGNTFVAPQDGYWASVDLMMASMGPTGDITGFAVEVPASGQPSFENVVGYGVLKRENMSMQYPARVEWQVPVATQRGKRYAFLLSSPGNHELWMTKNNKLSNGSYFIMTDGAWAIGDPSYDISFVLGYCLFYRNRLEIPLQPMQLAGGIANVDLLAVKYTPAQTTAEIHGQFNGVWKPISTYQPDDNSVFQGLPPLVPLKLVLQGTYDVMPMMGLGANSRLRVFRPRSDYKHISAERLQPSGAPAKTVLLETRLENWKGAGYHTHVARLRYGAGFNTFLNPSVVEDELAPDDLSGNTIIRRSTFVFPTPQTSYKIEQSGTTSNVLVTYHVALRFDVATTT